MAEESKPTDPTPSGEPGVSEADLDALLAEMQKTAATPSAASPSESTEPAPESTGDEDFDALLQQASFEDAAAYSPRDPAGVEPPQSAALPPDVDAAAFAFTDLQRAMSDAQISSIDLLRDVELNVKIELGRSRMLVEDVLKLAEGSVVELDKLAGDPVDVFVNERLVARGEVLVLNDNFCVRVNEIVATQQDEV